MEAYQCVATTRTGFIQQIVSGYVRNGYCYFVKGSIPEDKDPQQVDHKVIRLYGITASKSVRYRRKQRGEANLQYLRYGREWVMLATKGSHIWKSENAAIMNNCCRVPLITQGYSITYVPGDYVLNRDKEDMESPPQRDPKMRVRVQISKHAYRELQAELVGNARRRRADWYASRFLNIGFEPYAPIRKQLLELLRQVNARRAAHGMQKISPQVIRFKRHIVKPFEPVCRTNNSHEFNAISTERIGVTGILAARN